MVDYTLGFTIQIDVYYNPATLNTSSYYNFLNGRGNNTGFHSGMMMPGLLDASSFRGFWRNNSASSVISTTGLTADWYRFSMIVTSTTVQIKLLNLRTNVELSGNIASVGTVDSADTFAYTFGCYGISGTTGAYGTVGVNISNIKILRGSSTLLHIPLSEGHLGVVRDVISKTAYTLGFFSISAGWAKLADFSHYNFKNGFTLYKKDANPNIYVPNDSTGAEIPWTPLLSYVKYQNYKGTTTSYNQCESKFKLDDVSVLGDLYNADTDHILFTEGTGVAKEFDLKTLDLHYNRGYMYLNSDVQERDFMLYRTDKTLNDDLRVLKYIKQFDRVTYDESGAVNYDESGHAELTE